MDVNTAVIENFDEIIPALRKNFDCLRQSILKLSAHKCEFGTIKNDHLGNTITPRWNSPEIVKLEVVLKQIQTPNIVKQVKRLNGCEQFFSEVHCFFNSKTTTILPTVTKHALTITNYHHESLNVWKGDLTRATKMTQRLPRPGLKYVILSDASSQCTGFLLLTEDYLIDQKRKEKETYAPIFLAEGFSLLWKRIFPSVTKNFLVCILR